MNIFLETRIRDYFTNEPSFESKLLEAFLDIVDIWEIYEAEAERLNLAVWEVKLIAKSGSYSAAAVSLTVAHIELAEMLEMPWQDYSLIAFK